MRSFGIWELLRGDIEWLPHLKYQDWVNSGLSFQRLNSELWVPHISIGASNSKAC